MKNKVRQLIMVLGIMFVIGAATGITVQQVFISQINQTNGENFTKAVMPLDYVINSTAGTWKQNANRSIELTGSGAFSTRYNSTAACVINTVHQNTNSSSIMVIYTETADADTLVRYFNVSTSNPPTDGMILIQKYPPSSGYALIPVTFVVPANNYYKIQGTAGFYGGGTCVIYK